MSLNTVTLFGKKPRIEPITEYASELGVPSLFLKASVESLYSAVRQGSYSSDREITLAEEVDHAIINKDQEAFTKKLEVFLDAYMERLKEANKIRREYNTLNKDEDVLKRLNHKFIVLAHSGVISIHNAINMLENNGKLITSV